MAPTSYGTGRFDPAELASLGEASVIEEGVLIFNASHVHIGRDVYIGHRTMLCGDTRAELRIDDGTWIGPDCYLHSAGGIRIGRRTGIGPRVMMLTSTHQETSPPQAIIDAPLKFAAIDIGEGCDVGVGAVLLPGARLGDGVQIGAGSIVTGPLPAGTIAAGAPARVARRRGEPPPAAN
jgi:acetyltransferase-like isoleucine patch superfamily enzyme